MQFKNIKKIIFVHFIFLTFIFSKSISNIYSNSDVQVTIIGVGDIFLGGQTEKIIRKYGYKYPFEKVAFILNSADILFGNLESPLSSRGNPTKDINKVKLKKDYLLRASPSVVNSLNYGGFDIVSLANNHAMDYGKIALLDTINILSENGISQVGAGKNIYESYSPKIFQIKGLKIGFLAYSTILPANSTATSKHPGIAYARSLKSKILDKEIKDFLRKNIKIVRNKVDFLIISVHWGEELNFYPSPLQIQLGHFLIDSGADLVIGHHPHVVQGIEKYKGKLIVYSLGNFVFASKSELTKQSFILKTTINKDKKVKIEIIPILISKSQPQIISGRNALEILKRIKILSFKLNTNISIAGEKGVLENF